MTMRAVYNGIKGKKLREVPAHVRPMLNKEYIKNAYEQWHENYYQKYILTNSPMPVYHVCYGGMAFSFIVQIPEELRRHKEHQKKHKGH